MYATPSHVHNGHNLPHYTNHYPNGSQIPQHSPTHQASPVPPPPPPPSQRSGPSSVSKEPITVVGIPSVSIQSNRLVVGSSQSSQCCSRFFLVRNSYINLLSGSTRSYTPLKVLGDGSFGTVWLCDWHGTLPPNTPLSPMQCGAGARPEWAGKRLVAVKRMKKKWEGGWDECQKLKELEVRNYCFPAYASQLKLFAQVVACHPFPSQYNSPLRLFPSSSLEGTLFCV